MAAAEEQHQAYVQLLRTLLQDVVEVPADDAHPDCVFIEDTAVVVGKTAIIANIGATSRQGEEAPVASALQQRGYQLRHLQPPATLDGGDVLQLPGCSTILVGLSARTNAAAVQQMQRHLPQHVVHGVPVGYGLHLKPFDLGCGHCVCEQCFNTSKFALCVECRQPTNNPHLQYTLLRMLQPTSPTSFPIGCPTGCVIEEEADDAPGTPHPSAPVMEVEPWDPSDDSGSGSSSDASSRRTSSSLAGHTSSAPAAAAAAGGSSGRSIGSHRLSHQSSARGSSGGTSRAGWLHPGPSLLLAITSSCWRTWAAYSAAVAATIAQCQQLQGAAVAFLSQLLSRSCGLHNAGHLVGYCLATWLLGLLLYHWQLGLALLPVGGAALALLAFGGMAGSSGGCLLWPAKLAGAVLAGDAFIMAVPSAAAAGAVRAAWHGCVQQMLLVMFVVEVAVLLWREVQLLRQQQYVVAARQQQPGQRAWLGAGAGVSAAGGSCAAWL
ncbi:hypothetical protein OEZ86_013926 [Tetradesmus obliquus]|nr:hypothetical protein OEZ86_013926 [Tetradesmus obliquus]